MYAAFKLLVYAALSCSRKGFVEVEGVKWEGVRVGGKKELWGRFFRGRRIVFDHHNANNILLQYVLTRTHAHEYDARIYTHTRTERGRLVVADKRGRAHAHTH